MEAKWELLKRESAEKWELFHRISRFLQTAPKAVIDAYRAGWSEITLYPDGYTSMDSCGCCFSGHAPGWYGRNPKERYPWGIGKYAYRWEWICGLNGESKPGESPSGHSCCSCD